MVRYEDNDLATVFLSMYSGKGGCIRFWEGGVQANGADVHPTKTECAFAPSCEHGSDEVFLTGNALVPGYEGMDDYVRVSMQRLRQKREPDPANPASIQTRLHQGYLFQQSEVR